LQLIPRDAQFYDMFAEVAKRLTGSATLLHEAFQNPTGLEGDVAKIKVIEHECDNLTRDIIERIDRTFVTPFDREDIHALATTLDDVVDLIDGAGRRAVIFHITEVRPHCVKLSDVLFRAACCIEETVKKMKDPKAVSAGNRQLNLLEEEGDAVYHDGMDVLFKNATDAILVVKWKELFDRIEDAIDRCEDVGNVLQTISLKNA
jgi:uncharacterized protein